MGNDPATPVADARGRIWGYDNLHIIDGSLHVTNGGINPVLTILALGYPVDWPTPGGVEADGPDPQAGERLFYRCDEVQAGAEPGDDQQWPPGPADRGPQPDTVGLHEPDGGFRSE
jgi:hypothetical protein